MAGVGGANADSSFSLGPLLNSNRWFEEPLAIENEEINSLIMKMKLRLATFVNNFIIKLLWSQWAPPTCGLLLPPYLEEVTKYPSHAAIIAPFLDVSPVAARDVPTFRKALLKV